MGEAATRAGSARPFGSTACFSELSLGSSPVLQLVLHLRPNSHQLVTVNQPLPQIPSFARTSPYARKLFFQQQLQNQRRVPPIVFLLS